MTRVFWSATDGDVAFGKLSRGHQAVCRVAK